MQENLTLATEAWPVDRVRPYPGNPRIIPESAIVKVAESIKAFGWRQPLVVDRDGMLVVGHTRLLAAKRLGLATVPVHVADLISEAARAYRLADNRAGEDSRWDLGALDLELRALDGVGFDLGATGFALTDLADLALAFPSEPSSTAQAERPKRLGVLTERFGVAPFSVLNAREGWWQDRKRAWQALGIRSEIGRGAAPGGSPRPAVNYGKTKPHGDSRGRVSP